MSNTHMDEPMTASMQTSADVSCLKALFARWTKNPRKGMDSFEFVRCLTRAELIDGNQTPFTSHDADIVFFKVKERTARRMSFKQFRQAIKTLLATKSMVYHGVDQGRILITPVLPDDQQPPLSQGADLDEADSQNIHGSEATSNQAAEATWSRSEKDASKQVHDCSFDGSDGACSSSDESTSEDTPRCVPAPTTASTPSKNTASVFERLTDATHFTGTHKTRFDTSGKGRGVNGRDVIPKGQGSVVLSYRGGPVHSLAAITNRSPANARGVPLTADQQ